jgi:endonuclease YncB( thermonuclease family)
VSGWAQVAAAVVVFCAVHLGRVLGYEEAAAQAQQAAAMCRESLDAEVVTRRTLARRQDEVRLALADAVERARSDVGDAARACAEVARTCAVPGVWMDLGVLPLGQPEIAEVTR